MRAATLTLPLLLSLLPATFAGCEQQSARPDLAAVLLEAHALLGTGPQADPPKAAARLESSFGAKPEVPEAALLLARATFRSEQPERCGVALDAYFERATLRRLTEQTETNPAALRRILKDVRTKGYAAIQDELDYGIVSCALPIFGPHGRIVAAANCSDVTNRLDRDTMIKKRLPVLRQAVRRIEGMLTQHPELTNSVESVASDYVRSRAVARVGPPAAKLERPVSPRQARRRAPALELLIG